MTSVHCYAGDGSFTENYYPGTFPFAYKNNMSTTGKGSPDAGGDDDTVYFSFCKSVAQINKQILITSLLKKQHNLDKEFLRESD